MVHIYITKLILIENKEANIQTLKEDNMPGKKALSKKISKVTKQKCKIPFENRLRLVVRYDEKKKDPQFEARENHLLLNASEPHIDL